VTGVMPSVDAGENHTPNPADSTIGADRLGWQPEICDRTNRCQQISSGSNLGRSGPGGTG